MKILIVLLRLKGGVGSTNSEIANVLRNKGHKVDILSREDDYESYSFFDFFALKRVVNYLMKENGYDIVYTQDYSITFPLLFPSPIFWKKHFSCFCGIKTRGIHKLFQNVVGKIMGRKLVVIGDELKERFPNSTLIYRGVNFKKFKPLGKKRDCLGWMERDTENISEKDLQKISDSTGLKFAVAKDISPDKMNEFYSKCKVFVSLPTKAGYNNIWNEAMAAGVPIVIGNEKGAGTMLPFDKVLEGENNIERIKQIIKKPKKINYRKWLISNKFSWENKSNELIKFLEKGLKR